MVEAMPLHESLHFVDVRTLDEERLVVGSRHAVVQVAEGGLKAIREAVLATVQNKAKP